MSVLFISHSWSGPGPEKLYEKSERSIGMTMNMKCSADRDPWRVCVETPHSEPRRTASRERESTSMDLQYSKHSKEHLPVIEIC